MTPHVTAAWRGGDAQQRPGWLFTFAYDAETIAALVERAARE